MADIIKRFKKICRRQRMRYYIESLRNDFLSGGDDWSNMLKECGYHQCLQMHSGILFAKKEASRRKRSLHSKNTELIALKRLIEQGSFQDAKDRTVLCDIGIHQYFVQDISRMLLDCGMPYVPYNIPKKNLSDEKIAVYTALTGEYDSVHEILYKQPEVDYILYTNNKNLSSSTWDIRFVDSTLDNALLSRKIKMFPDKYLDKQYTASVYVDSNAFIYGDIANLVSVLNEKTTFAVTRHANTDSVKNEIEVCIKTKGINRIQAEAQYERYCAEGFKDDMGLAECGILVRRSNDVELRTLMELWYEEFDKGIRRDQISLLPCIQKRNFEKYTLLEGSLWHNQFCIIFGGHRKGNRILVSK